MKRTEIEKSLSIKFTMPITQQYSLLQGGPKSKLQT